ncbi:carbohydrate kinase family protein [Nocardia sp. NEAU-G5]|uniref:Carbohydrate kinase family protein n=1 Tax=Nocardia albiluteola TaxID=2842303 RepID=A0ABS6B2Q0_9NOCA|nr:carbohydrate kinase family protein [Nocardia albiluteola]MBU3064418.1 carbohydrate kinase family protein [Nocardia albiluteola]
MGTDEPDRREILVVGAYFVDLIFHGLPEPVRPGREVFADGFTMMPGGAYTLAMAAHRLGHDVVWATDFGTDPFSTHVLHAARAEGLDESAFRHQPTPLRSLTVALSTPEDRAMVSFQDPSYPQPLPSLLRQYRPRVLMVPQLRYDADTVHALKLARHLGITVVMDCQDVAVDVDTPGVRAALASTDIFAPNAEEALRLTRAPTMDDAISRLNELVSTVVIKLGSAGATATYDGERYGVAAPQISALDTTGAGDCFNVGFVHGLLAGWPPAKCLAAAVACGTAATTGPGSSTAPGTADLERWLARTTISSRAATAREQRQPTAQPPATH